MSGMSDYLEDKVLDHVLGITAFPMPSTVAVALFTADPNDTLTNEVTGGTYARKVVTGGSNWNASVVDTTGKKRTNALELLFDIPTGVTITHWGILDAATGGNLLLSGPLTAAQTFATAGQYKITAGSASVKFD